MKDTIQTIIQSKIPNKSVFDAHTIINYLIQYHHDIYLSSYKNEWTTAYYHSEISKTIASFEDGVIEIIGECWSMNINNKFNQNKCWKKI